MINDLKKTMTNMRSKRSEPVGFEHFRGGGQWRHFPRNYRVPRPIRQAAVPKHSAHPLFLLISKDNLLNKLWVGGGCL